MKKKIFDEPASGVLTEHMDIGTDGFNDFQAILLNKSKERSSNQNREIELLALKFQMEDYLEIEKIDIKLPGDFLKQYLSTFNISQKKFAEYINMNPSNFNKIMTGERPLNYELAIIFGEIFNVDAIIWIKIQAKNELERIRKTQLKKYRNYNLKDLVS